ncbi:hypothetical protein A1Q2_01147 [Trichosporon asahii var. asahii CBS 8904]|uniref:TPR-like protein n=2 Tax=Trichosporon asahii var. asahii TaxID=189963 RepID=K1VK78_TRIAC|nr:hypothetical protein A1Q1_04924 [Trichosporon asahii var. asahii CBS 2479]EJT46492.1 hypothetical protein A1Q1_04924 [Trichosporon asahii var. asahii CBS 2479]EKD04575.1 hypothetical protein A1Q2_01147 [Trichosporon asahii var. asahii CBS 8904]
MPRNLPDDFPDLPSFDARDFEPPAWAKQTYQRKGPSSEDGAFPAGGEDDVDEWSGPGSPKEAGVELEAPGTFRFTTEELKRGLSLKNTGNKHFTANPQRLDEARKSYLAAIDTLPSCPRPEKTKSKVETSGLAEITDEEAAQIDAERLQPKDTERDNVEADVRECTKAVWGNLAAVYLAEKEYRQAVEACNSAFHRRAQANENIDYQTLVKVLPAHSPQLPAARKALTSLPSRIAVQQEKEKNEMMDKLKELGNGLLGKFGLSTDMFKFDQQPGGGYNMRFQS